MKCLSNNEYIVLSLYLLVRELEFGNYNLNWANYDEVRDFTGDWFKRFEVEDLEDVAMLQFKRGTPAEPRSRQQAQLHHRRRVLEDRARYKKRIVSGRSFVPKESDCSSRAIGRVGCA